MSARTTTTTPAARNTGRRKAAAIAADATPAAPITDAPDTTPADALAAPITVPTDGPTDDCHAFGHSYESGACVGCGMPTPADAIAAGVIPADATDAPADYRASIAAALASADASASLASAFAAVPGKRAESFRRAMSSAIADALAADEFVSAKTLSVALRAMVTVTGSAAVVRTDADHARAIAVRHVMALDAINYAPVIAGTPESVTWQAIADAIAAIRDGSAPITDSESDANATVLRAIVAQFTRPVFRTTGTITGAPKKSGESVIERIARALAADATTGADADGWVSAARLAARDKSSAGAIAARLKAIADDTDAPAGAALPVCPGVVGRLGATPAERNAARAAGTPVHTTGVTVTDAAALESFVASL